MSYKNLQNKLLTKFDYCKVPDDKKFILKNYFNKFDNKFSYEKYKYTLNKNYNLLNAKPKLDELKDELNLDSDLESCIFNYKKENDKNKKKIKEISKNQELKKLRKDILLQRKDCNNLNIKKQESIEFWKITSIILFIVTFLILALYIYNLD